MATRNPVNSPVEVGTLSHYFQGFKHPGWCKMSSINSIPKNMSLPICTFFNLRVTETLELRIRVFSVIFVYPQHPQ